ncbi:MRE11 double-strand break endo/exonuclease [Arthrobacter phage Mimi]|nr:MRE11 double-strand break endo/exonuclease [Arthrobacter phage Mimi]
MTNTPNGYAPQCRTCNSSVDIQQYICKLHKRKYSYNAISRLVFQTHGFTISPDALSNHLQKHVSVPTETLTPLLGVVNPPVKAPKGWEAKVELDGDNGEVTSTPQNSDKLTDFSQILEEFDIDTEEFEVDGPARISKWQTFHGEWLTSYKFKIKKRSTVVDISDLIKLVQNVKPQAPITSGDYAFVFAAGDLQLGKSDGDGVEGTVRRYRESLQKAVNKVHENRDLIGPILVSFVGDCIEGMVSQGGRNARRTVLSTTQQVNLLRKLMIETVKAFAPLTNDLKVVSVPGNHDEAQREPVSTDGSDSWAVDALRAVSQGLEFNPEAFGHVTCEEVAFDELTKVVEVAGTKIGHAHGHQWRKGKHWEWWSGQHWGGHEIGEADILLCGHFHTGMYEQENYKHIIRTPAFEQESTYFRHLTGKIGNPSAVTFLTKDGKLKDISFE